MMGLLKNPLKSLWDGSVESLQMFAVCFDHDSGNLLEVCHCLVCFAMSFFVAFLFDMSFRLRFVDV